MYMYLFNMLGSLLFLNFHVLRKMVDSRQVLLLVCGCILANAIKHPEFSEWDTTAWIVSDFSDVIELTCHDATYYPFNNLRVAQSAQWILPKSTSYYHLKPSQQHEGWQVGDLSKSYNLTITKTNMNVPEVINGQYVCAVLAKTNLDQQGSIYSWYYLRWGVGLYKDTAAMNIGGIERWVVFFENAYFIAFLTLQAIVNDKH